MMILLADCKYFPEIDFYKKVYKQTNIFFDEYEIYPKMGGWNHCRVAGGAGPLLLSVPLQGGRKQKHPLKDVLICNDQPWQGQHWKTLESCYNRSPWFDSYREELFRLYKTPYRFLMDWNLDGQAWVMEKLGLDISIHRGLPDAAKLAAEDLRFASGKGNDSTNPDSVNRYHQVFEDRNGFIPDLSILDLLFCEGPGADKWLAASTESGGN